MATTERPRGDAATHEVANQATSLEGYNTYESDEVLVEALRREGGEWAEDRVSEVGAFSGSARAIRWGFEANENPPRLRTHDRFGNRIDEVEFHPSWHQLLGAGVGFGSHALPWREPQPGAHVARAAMFVSSQAEAGVGCPLSMTYSAIPALRKQPEIAAEWEPRFTSLGYDGELRPAADKPGALCGMGMTEKQGGSDVRANTTVAVPLNGGGPGAEYALTGHKWFMSAPMCDAFLVLAQADGGLSCFLMPRFTPDGERNPILIQRLKDKLGNRSNASSEVEFRNTWARMVGEEGRGVATIIEMVNHTRLDCCLGAAAGMRAGVAAAIHHTSQRSAFGALLIEQPLMRNVLADLAIESEAATIGAMRLARAYDESIGGDEGATQFKRIANAVLKYWLCKRAVPHAGEALECFGGNGYVEESGMPRLYRESPLNSIWEGSGNVQCLDVLRAMVRGPEALEAFFGEVGEAAGADRRLDAAAVALREELADLEGIESRARRLVERMALVLQGSLVVRFGDPAVADAFCASRLGGDWGRAFGTLPAGTDFDRIIDRHTVLM
ncbi:MAG TPA: acyl-CoA dehydrogenase family protein [Solirubrobacterales bacterium]|nr:acyl-CoA dehydrogenase family protein [Solirubrobacterales bacterium]